MDSSPLLPDLPPQESPHEYFHLPKNVIENIFSSLSPRDLALASGVASSWRATASLAPWDFFYSRRWPITPLDVSRAAYTSWHSVFSSRMTLARAFKGRPQLDRLSGHLAGVKVCKILSESNLLLTGSVDRRLSLWDLETGTKLAFSLQHAGTVRSLAIDDELLITGSSDHRIRVWKARKDTSSSPQEQEQQEVDLQQHEPHPHDFYLAHQQQQHTSMSNAAIGALNMPLIEQREKDFPFYLKGARTVLTGGHTGPVTALELAPTALFSGSWDYCVRVWDRSTREEESGGRHIGTVGGGGGDVNFNDTDANLQCIQVLHFDDMVTDMAFKREKLFVAAGSEVHIVDAGGGGGGGGLRKISSLRRHASNSIVTAVEASEDERFLFYSTAEGGVYACDVRDPRHHHQYDSPNTSTSRCTPNDPGFLCASAVTGLSWDFPWLAASLQNGEVFLFNAENTLLGGYDRSSSRSLNNTLSTIGSRGRGFNGSGVTSSSVINRGQQQQQQQGQSASQSSSRGWFSRALTAGVPGGVQCVDISGKWLVAGYENGCIVSWDFSRAAEAEQAAQALRTLRRKNREKRRENAKSQKKQGHTSTTTTSGILEQEPAIPRSSAMLIPSYSATLTTETTTSTETPSSSAAEEEEPQASFHKKEGSDLQFLNTLSTSLPETLTTTTTTYARPRTTASSLRVPAPISLRSSLGGGGGGDIHHHGEGSEGHPQQQQQGRDNRWHVLRLARSTSNPDDV